MREILKYFVFFGWIWDYAGIESASRRIKAAAVIVNLFIAVVFIVLLSAFFGLVFLNQVSPATNATTISEVAPAVVTLPTATNTQTPVAPMPSVTPTPKPVIDGLFSGVKILDGYSEGDQTTLVLDIPEKGVQSLPILCGNNQIKVRALLDYLKKYALPIKNGEITFYVDINRGLIVSLHYLYKKSNGTLGYDAWTCGEKISP